MAASDREISRTGRAPDRVGSAAPTGMRLLDLRGLKCPLPVLRTRKALTVIAPGDRLEVLADDPLAGLDIPNFLREAGEELVEQARLERGWRFVVGRRAR